MQGLQNQAGTPKFQVKKIAILELREEFLGESEAV